MTTCTLNIAKDFSPNPAGRYLSDGPYSGEAFRENHLWPALQKCDEVTVHLDGAMGFGSSFLEEAFGGLVREHGQSLQSLKQKIRVKSSVKTYEARIWSYVADAAKNLR